MTDANVEIKEVSDLRLPQINTRRSSMGFDFSVINTADNNILMSINRSYGVATPGDRYYTRIIDQKPGGDKPLLLLVTFRENQTPFIQAVELDSANPGLIYQLLDPATDVAKLLGKPMKNISVEHVPPGETGHNEGVRV